MKEARRRPRRAEPRAAARCGGAILGIARARRLINSSLPRAARARIAGAVPSSERSARALTTAGIRIVDLNEVATIRSTSTAATKSMAASAWSKARRRVDPGENRAAVATTFVCIADESKRVDVLGRFPLPVEVIPLARAYVTRELTALGGRPCGARMWTDNGNAILDVHGLRIVEPIVLEARINQIVGRVSNGLFAARGADVLLLAPLTV